MSRLFKRANKRISLGNAAALLIVTTLIGQVLGFLRIKLVNANFSAIGPDSTDAYFAAFKIPDLVFFALAAGALGVAFMPFLADRLAKNDKKGIWELSNSLLNLLAIVMAIVGVIIFVFAEQLVHFIVAPNLSPEQLHNATTIMRLIAFNPLIFTISGIFTSVQQVFGRFFFFAIAPLIYNTSIILSIFIFKDSLGLIGLGVGALIGALLQLVVVLGGFIGLGYSFKAQINFRNNNFRQILRQLPPRSIDQGVDSINSIVETNFARRLGEGFLSYYENAYVLYVAPTLLVGTTIATAAFPRLNDRLAQNRKDLFRKDFRQVLRLIFWLIMPIAIVMYFTRGYLARLIFSRDAPEIALILGFFVGAIVFRTIYIIVSRWFYSNKDTKTPLFVSLFAIFINIILAYLLSRPQPDGYGVVGLAMAQSIVAFLEVLILMTIMFIRDRKLFNAEFWDGVVKIIAVSGFTVIATYAMVSIYPLLSSDTGFFKLGSKLFIISLTSFLVYILMSIALGLGEVQPVVKKVKDLVLKPVKIQ